MLYAGGISVLMLAGFYLLIDIYKLRWGIKWMVVIGSNAIIAYVAWHLFEPAFTSVSAVFVDGMKRFIGNWYQSVLYFGSFMVLFLIMKFMYKRKIFIKI